MINSGDLLQGRYRVVGLLGRGGMGAVYEAVDERLGNQVALKQCSFDKPEVLRQFEREARLLAGMRHSSVTRVIDHFIENGTAFLVMEYIPGRDLGDMLRDGEKFEVDRVLTWTDELLAALEYLHSRQPPVIHRDIKPQNLKLTPGDEIILLDFGLAKGYTEQSSVKDASRSVYGYTPNYAPLEQIEGTEGTDGRSDLYSLAATTYHLLTATQPPGVLARIGKISDGLPDPLVSPELINPQVPPAVGAVLIRAMAIMRDRRYTDATEMRRALGAARASQGPTYTSSAPTILPSTPVAATTMPSRTTIPAAAEPAGPNKQQNPVRRSKAPLVIVVIIVLLLLLASAAIVFLGRLRGGPDDETSIRGPVAALPATTIDAQPDRPTTPEGMTLLPGHTESVRSVAWSTDGSMLASGSWDSSARVWQIGGTSAPEPLATITRPDATINAVAFSPDLRMVAVGGYDSSGSTISFHDPRSGSEIRSPIHERSGLVGSVLFSPDGRLLYTTIDSRVMVWDLASGESVRTIAGNANPSIALSADGTRLALGSTNDTVLRVFDTANGELVREFTDPTKGVLSVAFAPDGHNLAAGSYDSYARVWSLLTGDLVRGIPHRDLDMPFSIAFHPRLPLLATGSYRHVRLWNAASGVPQSELEPGEAGIIYSLQFSPDGRTLAAGTGGGSVLLIAVQSN